MKPMKKVYERIFFAQDHQAEEALAILEHKGEEAAVEHLSQWHFPGEHETEDYPSHGKADTVYRTPDGYILSYNTGIGYIGLEFEAED